MNERLRRNPLFTGSYTAQSAAVTNNWESSAVFCPSYTDCSRRSNTSLNECNIGQEAPIATGVEKLAGERTPLGATNRVIVSEFPTVAAQPVGSDRVANHLRNQISQMRIGETPRDHRGCSGESLNSGV